MVASGRMAKSEHGLYVDQEDNVWITGNGSAAAGGRAAAPQDSPWATNPHGGDGFLLKFDVNGNFKMRVGGTPMGPNSNDTQGGINGTPQTYQATQGRGRELVGHGRRQGDCPLGR